MTKRLLKDKPITIICHIIAVAIVCSIVFDKYSDYQLITVLNDEFGYWANAAVMAGYPWKSLLQHTPYYSGGYSFLLVPLFHFLHDGIAMYRAAIIINAVLLYLSYVLAFISATKLFPLNNSVINSLSSMASVFLVPNLFYSRIAWPEIAITFLFWLVIYLAITLENTFSFPRLLAFYLSVFFNYLIHQRTIGLLLTSLLFVLFVFNKNKKNLHKSVCFLVVLFWGLIYFGQRVMSGYQFDLIDHYRVSALNDLAVNAKSVTSYFNKIVDNIGDLSLSICGKMLVLIISSLGVGSVAFIAWFSQIKSTIKGKKPPYLYSISFILLTVLVAYALDSVQMMNGVRKDIVVYSRYLDYAIGPLVLLGINFINKRRLVIGAGITLIVGGVLSMIVTRFSWSVTENGFNVICSPLIGGIDQMLKNDFSLIPLIFVLIALLFVIVLLSVQNFGNRYFKYTVSIFLIIFNVMFSYYPIKVFNEFRKGVVLSTDAITDFLSEEYSDSKVIYLCNNELDMYCMAVKYLQYRMLNQEICVVDNEDDIKESDSFLLIVNSADDKDYDIVNGLEPVFQNGSLRIYSVVYD